LLLVNLYRQGTVNFLEIKGLANFWPWDRYWNCETQGKTVRVGRPANLKILEMLIGVDGHQRFVNKVQMTSITCCEVRAGNPLIQLKHVIRTLLTNLWSPSTLINISKIWRIDRTKKATELHQTLYSCPNIKEKSGLVHETTVLVQFFGGLIFRWCHKFSIFAIFFSRITGFRNIIVSML